MIIIIIIHLYSHIAHPRSFILLWKRVSFLCSYTYSFSLFRKCWFVQSTIRHSFQQKKFNRHLIIQIECSMNPRKWDRSLLLLVYFFGKHYIIRQHQVLLVPNYCSKVCIEIFSFHVHFIFFMFHVYLHTFLSKT